MLICLSGLPGSGKTTLIKKIVEYLKQKNVNVEGFITEEVRDVEGCRLGFDILTLQNERKIFARKRGIESPYKVGSYSVDITSFEQLILPVLGNPKTIMIIDEIGKMELISEKFKSSIANLVVNPEITIVATIPLKSNDEFIRNLKKNSKKIIYVDGSNRNNLLQEIIRVLDMK